MSMRFSRRTCLAMGLALGLTACFGNASAFSVVEDFYAAALKEDADKAVSLMALRKVSAQEMQMVKPKVQVLMAQIKIKADANGGLDKMELVQEDIDADGEKARLQVRTIFKNGKSTNDTITLIKEEGKWKIKL